MSVKLNLDKFLYDKEIVKKVTELKKCKIDERGEFSWKSFIKSFLKTKVFSSEAEYLAFLMDYVYGNSRFFYCNSDNFQSMIYGLGCTLDEKDRKKLYVPHFSPNTQEIGGALFETDKESYLIVNRYELLSSKKNAELLISNSEKMRPLTIPEQEFLLEFHKATYSDSPVKSTHIDEVNKTLNICSLEEINNIVHKVFKSRYHDDHCAEFQDQFKIEIFPYATWFIGEVSDSDFNFNEKGIKEAAKELTKNLDFDDIYHDDEKIALGTDIYLGKLWLKQKDSMSYEEALLNLLASEYSVEDMPRYGREMCAAYKLDADPQDDNLLNKYRFETNAIALGPLPDAERLMVMINFLENGSQIKGYFYNGEYFIIEKKDDIFSLTLNGNRFNGISSASIGYFLSQYELMDTPSIMKSIESNMNQDFCETHFYFNFNIGADKFFQNSYSQKEDYMLYWDTKNTNHALDAMLVLPDEYGCPVLQEYIIDDVDKDIQRIRKGEQAIYSYNVQCLGALKNSWKKVPITQDFLDLDIEYRQKCLAYFFKSQTKDVPDLDEWDNLPFAVNIIASASDTKKMIVIADAVTNHILIIGFDKNKSMTKYDYPTGDAFTFKLTKEYELSVQVKRHSSAYGEKLYGMLTYYSDCSLLDSPALLHPAEKKRIYEKVLNLFNYLFKFSNEELTAGLTKKSSDEKLTEVVTAARNALKEDNFRIVAEKLAEIDVPAEEENKISLDEIETVSAVSISTPDVGNRRVRKPR